MGELSEKRSATHEIAQGDLFGQGVGARQGDILRQFLIEAVLICLFGGVLGVLSALGVGALSSLLSLGVPFLFTPGPVLAALACSSAIGLGFGYFPARNAAQLAPIQALAAE